MHLNSLLKLRPPLYRHRDGLGIDTTDTDTSNEKTVNVKSVIQQKEHT